jgi:hypothetical protein
LREERGLRVFENRFLSRILRPKRDKIIEGCRKLGKPDEKRPLERPRHRWKYNIKIDIREIGCSGMDWIHLAQYRDQWRTLVNAVINLRFP